jgi:hypothetical protein
MMSALGHEQTSCHARVMSVNPLKADIHHRRLHVRYVPKADIPHRPGEDGSRAILMAKNNQASGWRRPAPHEGFLAQRVAATVFHQERRAGGKSRAEH